jgi:hypothetical protein
VNCFSALTAASGCVIGFHLPTFALCVVRWCSAGTCWLPAAAADHAALCQHLKQHIPAADPERGCVRYGRVHQPHRPLKACCAVVRGPVASPEPLVLLYATPTHHCAVLACETGALCKQQQLSHLCDSSTTSLSQARHCQHLCVGGRLAPAHDQTAAWLQALPLVAVFKHVTRHDCTPGRTQRFC